MDGLVMILYKRLIMSKLLCSVKLLSHVY